MTIPIVLFGPCPVCDLSATDVQRTRAPDGSGSWHCLRCLHQFAEWAPGGDHELGRIPHDHYVHASELDDLLADTEEMRE